MNAEHTTNGRAQRQPRKCQKHKQPAGDVGHQFPRSFVKLAIDAGKGEIVDVIVTAVNFGSDVRDVERGERRVILMQMTIFASVLSTHANLGPDLSANHL